MCTACQAASFDSNQADAFAERMLEVMNSTSLAFMLSIGHRTGLFDTMDGAEPMTSQQLAEKAGLSERYVREWLGAMTVGRIVTYDPETQTYSLPAEHAAYLTRAARPNNLASTMQWFSVLGAIEDRIVDVFQQGGGVRYEEYNRFHEVMAEESDQSVVAGLLEHIIPLMPEMREKLESGIDVLDAGCGGGRALIALAEAFPNSHFTGMDFSEQGIGMAQQEANRRGLKNVTFMVQDLPLLDGSKQFDLITTFDVIHDQAKPAETLAALRRSLKPGGTYLMQDIRASSRLEKNLDHPVAPMLYTISTMHCMTVSLALGGAGLGTVWGEELARDMLGEAGFTVHKVEQLPHDFLNSYFVCS